MSSNLNLGFSEINLRMDNSREHKIYAFEDFRLDLDHRMLYRRTEELSLAPKTVDMLIALVERRGKIVSKDELLEAVWPDAIVEESNLFLYLSILRKILGKQNNNGKPYIETLRSRGYRFNGDVQLIQNSADGHREFVVDKPNQDRADIETQSGRTYKKTHRHISEISDPEPRRENWPSKRPVFAVASVIAVITVLAFAYPYFTNQPPIESIAVMPFVNESGNTELEYLSEGMTETLSDRLSKLPGLKVKATSSVSRYKGKNIDAPTVGKELNASAVLFGHVVLHGEDLNVRVELVDAQTGNRIWGNQYMRRQTDLISLQSEIARDVVNKLKVKLSAPDEQKLARNYTENVEAYNLFLKGRFHLRKLTQPEIEKGIADMQKAVDIDPSYALAYAGMAEAYRALAMAVEMPPGEVWPKAKAAAQRAVEIDDDLAEGRSCLGSAFFYHDWNWAEAENQFVRALELSPNSSMAHLGYADLLSRMGRSEEAQEHLKRARELEPLSPFLNAFEAFSIRNADEALERVRFAIDLDPNFYFAHMIAGSIYGRKQMYTEAITEYRLAKQLAPDQTWSDAVGLVPMLMQNGKPDEVRTILNEMLRLSKLRFIPPYNIALVYNALGEKEEALAWLEKGYEQRDPRMTIMKTGPSWKNLRGDPRFQDLLRRVGFAPD